MEKALAKFDWIGWLASVPGIPAGWGQPAQAAAVAPPPPEDDTPLPLAA